MRSDRESKDLCHGPTGPALNSGEAESTTLKQQDYYNNHHRGNVNKRSF